MDLIKINVLKKELKELQADNTTMALIVNTAKLYNIELEKYLKGGKVHPYMLSSLNGQVMNQLMNLKKLKIKDKKELPTDEPDEFMKMLATVEKSKSRGF